MINKYNITIVAGARPNFMKIAPIIHEINKVDKSRENISFRLVHTGQHYDKNMSDSFFVELGIPLPDINLNCHSGTQAQITSSIMLKFEKELMKNPSNLVLVVGDVTSTMACAITAQKLNIKVAHVEAGIRSNDWSMPEEINRLVTDSITNYFFTTTKLASENLLKSGINKNRIFFVGNTMIDTLLSNIDNLRKPSFWNSFSLEKKKYIVVTLHRPSNVDDSHNLKKIINLLIKYSDDLKIIFPMHPRTSKIFNKLKIIHERLKIVPPLSYLEFNYLVRNSKCVFTDSGGITEETTVMSVPCITLRDNTERPETVDIGTNELIGKDPDNIKGAFEKLLKNKWKKGKVPKFWDGKTSERIVKNILKIKSKL
jgi:UDP-N-acetylglucosamine 2-epimerase (non-hydrolysing)